MMKSSSSLQKKSGFRKGFLLSSRKKDSKTCKTKKTNCSDQKKKTRRIMEQEEEQLSVHTKNDDLHKNKQKQETKITTRVSVSSPPSCSVSSDLLHLETTATATTTTVQAQHLKDKEIIMIQDTDTDTNTTMTGMTDATAVEESSSNNKDKRKVQTHTVPQSQPQNNTNHSTTTTTTTTATKIPPIFILPNPSDQKDSSMMRNNNNNHDDDELIPISTTTRTSGATCTIQPSIISSSTTTTTRRTSIHDPTNNHNNNHTNTNDNKNNNATPLHISTTFTRTADINNTHIDPKYHQHHQQQLPTQQLARIIWYLQQEQQQETKVNNYSLYNNHVQDFLFKNVQTLHQWIYCWDLVLEGIGNYYNYTDTTTTTTRTSTRTTLHKQQQRAHVQLGIIMLNQPQGRHHFVSFLKLTPSSSSTTTATTTNTTTNTTTLEHQPHDNKAATTDTTTTKSMNNGTSTTTTRKKKQIMIAVCLLEQWLHYQQEEQIQNDNNNNNSTTTATTTNQNDNNNDTLPTIFDDEKHNILETFFPPLAQIVMFESSSSSSIIKRTNLSQKCLMVAYEIIHVTLKHIVTCSHYYHDDTKKERASTALVLNYLEHQVLWNHHYDFYSQENNNNNNTTNQNHHHDDGIQISIIPTLIQLWTIHQQWLLDMHHKKKNNTSHKQQEQQEEQYNNKKDIILNPTTTTKPTTTTRHCHDTTKVHNTNIMVVDSFLLQPLQGNDNTDTRKHCTMMVLSDFIELTTSCYNHYHYLLKKKKKENTPHNNNDKNFVTRNIHDTNNDDITKVMQQWYKEMLGIRIPNNKNNTVSTATPLVSFKKNDTSTLLNRGWGGLKQCLCTSQHKQPSHQHSSSTLSSSKTKTDTTICKEIIHALEVLLVLNDCQDGNNNNNDNDDLDMSRATVRGLVAWLGQKKSNLSLLTKYGGNLTEEGGEKEENKDISKKLRSSSSSDDDHTIQKTNQLDRVTELGLKLFGSSLQKISSRLLLALINHMCSKNEGLPKDLINMNPDSISTKVGSAYFSCNIMLAKLKQIKSLNRQNVLSQEVSTFTSTHSSELLENEVVDDHASILYHLLTRCILSKGESLLMALVSYCNDESNHCSEVMFELLATVLNQTLCTINTSNNGELNAAPPLKEYSSLAYLAGDKLIEGISRNTHSQNNKMKGVGELLACLPDVEKTVPKLLSLLAKVLVDNEDQPSPLPTSLVDAIDTILLEIMKRNVVEKRVERFVNVVVDSLLKIEESFTVKQSNSNDSGGNNNLHLVCSKFVCSWKRYLLLQDSSSLGADEEKAYANLLQAVGAEMFRVPSSTVPLTLLGSLCLEENSSSCSSCRRKICHATSTLLRICLEEMQKTTRTTTNNEIASERVTVFLRLSPLLLLRRIPRWYFSMSASLCRKIGEHLDDISPSAQQYSDLLGGIISEITLRLDISKTANYGFINNTPKFTAEERKLSADIAARCLPFSSVMDSHGSSFHANMCCFEAICRPAFSNLFHTILSIKEDNKMSSPQSQQPVVLTNAIRPAKAALYAACSYISLAQDNEDGDGILKTASFAIHVLASPAIDPTILTHQPVILNEEEWVELQTGCIDFFAICLESYSLRRFNKLNRSENPMEKADSVTALLSTLGDIYHSLVSIIQCGQSSNADWINSAPWKGATTEIESFSPSARTCIWNAFLVVSQRCSLKNGHLNHWSKHTTPWIVRWGYASSSTIDTDEARNNNNVDKRSLYHPLCMAAALQLVFVVLTRSKSFDMLAETNTKEEIKRGVHLALQWGLQSFKHSVSLDSSGLSTAKQTMRKAALKLILSIVSELLQSQSDAMISNEDWKQIVSTLQDSVTTDTEDSEVRMLATHFLQVLVSSTGASP